MNAGLEVLVEESGGKAKVAFKGVVNEDSDFGKIKDLQSSEIEIDWGYVASINSCGIREWTNCLSSLNADMKINYLNCPVHIVEQINMIVDFLRKNATVQSMFCPYYCDNCDKEESILLDINEIKNKTAPVKNCKECNGELEFDAVEKQYFSFLD